jgi:hypothetical protein
MRTDALEKFDFIYLVTPKLSDLTMAETYPPCLQVNGRYVPIVNAAQPNLYPQLYRAELWHDSAHLNEEGAAVFSRIVAGQLMGNLQFRSTKRDCASF